MNIIREPKVYLIGSPKFETGDAYRALNDMGFKPSLDLWTQDAEEIVEMAGRTCYQSYGKGRNHEAFFENILESGHGSVLEHVVWNFLFTGVSRSLTHELIRHRAGWAYCLSGDTIVMSYAANKSASCKKWTLRQLYEWSMDKKRKGRIKLIHLRTVNADGIVESGHIKSITYSGRKPVYKITAGNRTIKASKDHRFFTNNGWMPLSDIQIGDLLAINGLPAYKNPDWIRSKYLDENMERPDVAALAGVSDTCLGQWIQRFGLQKPKSQYPNRVGNPNGIIFTDEIRAKISHAMSGNRNHQWKGDDVGINGGHIRALKMYPADECSLCQSKELVERHHVDRNPCNNIPENVQILCSKCHHAEHASEWPRYAIQYLPVTSIEYIGVEDTYDIEMEGTNHNFVANSFVVHNSQLSQRYVDESEANFIEPAIIANDSLAHELWLESITASRSAYTRLATLVAMRVNGDHPELSQTDRRKMARQAARSVLPNATETKIFVTANARALRHFMELRGNIHADTEIRSLAVQILRIMLKEAPNIFGDMKIVELPDGTHGIKSAHRKV